MIRRPPSPPRTSTLVPYTTLVRSGPGAGKAGQPFGRRRIRELRQAEGVARAHANCRAPNPHRVDMDRRQLSAVAQLPDDRLRDFLDRSVDEDEVERRMLLNAALKLALYNLRALPQQRARARSEIGI